MSGTIIVVFCIVFFQSSFILFLQSTATVEQLIQDLRNLMHSLPNYAPQFLEMVCKMLTIFKESCYDAYKGYCHLLSHSLLVQ